jgi:hypothetical protein
MWWRRQRPRLQPITAPQLPDASGQEFCTRTWFSLQPAYPDQLAARVKWQQVFKRATRLSRSLPDKSFTSADLQQLADTIDDVFFEGAFQRCCSASPKGKAHFVVQDDVAATPLYHSCQVAAAYDPNTNRVIFNRPAWQCTPSLAAPVQV